MDEYKNKPVYMFVDGRVPNYKEILSKVDMGYVLFIRFSGYDKIPGIEEWQSTLRNRHKRTDIIIELKDGKDRETLWYKGETNEDFAHLLPDMNSYV